MCIGARCDFNILVLLGAQTIWKIRKTIWKIRNDTVFNGVAPKVYKALLLAWEEAELWMIADAKGLSVLVAARLLV